MLHFLFELRCVLLNLTVCCIWQCSQHPVSRCTTNVFFVICVRQCPSLDMLIKSQWKTYHAMVGKETCRAALRRLIACCPATVKVEGVRCSLICHVVPIWTQCVVSAYLYYLFNVRHVHYFLSQKLLSGGFQTSCVFYCHLNVVSCTQN